ncbi:hypothetical protein RMQ97_05970 [Maricaulis sp. D1M11]|uniref:hypothetical protein n=1 Tax=Maricaulis sp. D1M11 TaxID=3076117 RepID=UPI0039B42842
MTPTPTALPLLPTVWTTWFWLVRNLPAVAMMGLPYTALYALSLIWMQIGPVGALAGVGGFLISLSGLLAMLAFQGAVFRMHGRGEAGGLGALRLGADEGRLFIVQLLVGFLVLLVAILAVIFWAAVQVSIANGVLQANGIDPENNPYDAATVMSLYGPSEIVVLVIVSLIVIAAMGWLIARLALAYPATIIRGRIQVMKIWPVSNQNAWRITLVAALTLIPVMLVEIGLYEIAVMIVGSSFLETVQRGVEADVAGFARGQAWMRWIGLFTLINLPLQAALFSGVFLFLSPQDRSQDG